MFRKDVCVGISLLVLACAFPVAAQQTAAASASTVVPPMVKFSGSLSDLKGQIRKRRCRRNFFSV
jgi:hypothetical protein